MTAHVRLIRAGCYLPTRAEVALKEPEWLYSVLTDWFWESPTDLISIDAQLKDVLRVLWWKADLDRICVSARVSTGGFEANERRMSNSENRKVRRDRQAQEVEQSQRELRESIANTERLLDQSDALLQRHRRECEDQDD